VMVVSDVGLHANKLIGVARGNLFPTSLTQHTPPFVVPYGVSFYVLLLPLYRAGLDPAWLVRGAAALSGIAASLALLRTLAPSGPRRAALAVLLLQLLPGTFLIYSYGNLSNVFAQSLMVAFFCWWVGGAPGGWPLGAALLGTAATAHLSGFIVSAALCGALALARRRDRTGDRTRLWAIAAGLGAGAAYYAAFLPLVWASLARMGEGGGQGGAASRGMAAAFVRQLRTAVELWGIPVLPLALLGRPRPAAGRPLDRDLAAYWAGCGLLLVPAVLSPLDVRYLHALGVPIAIAAAGGVAALAKRGRIATLAAAALLGAQAVLALRTILESVIERYR